MEALRDAWSSRSCISAAVGMHCGVANLNRAVFSEHPGHWTRFFCLSACPGTVVCVYWAQGAQ